MRFFDLTKDLRFADDERIESGRYTKQMAGDVDVGNVVDVRLQQMRIDPVKFGDEGGQRQPAGVEIIARGVQLSPVAGRQHDCLANWRARGERAVGRLEAARVKIEPLAQFDRRTTMTEAN